MKKVVSDKLKEDHLKSFMKILCTGNALMLLYIIIWYRYPEMDFSGVNVFFSADDRFMDLFNNFKYSIDLLPYEYKWANATPLFLLISYCIGKPLSLLAGSIEFDQIRYMLAGVVVNLEVILVIVTTYYLCLKYLLKDRVISEDRQIFYWFVLITSYPMLWAMDRGNYVIWAAALIGVFIVLYDKGYYKRAAVVLGIAAALKVYPALLGCLFLSRKQWKPAIICASTGIITTVIPLCIFKGGFVYSLTQFLSKTKEYVKYGNISPVQNLSYNNSLHMLWDIPYYMFRGNKQIGPEELANFNQAGNIVLMVLLILTIALVFFLKNKQDQILLLCCIMLLYPFVSGDYNLTIIVLPLVYWVVKDNNEHKWVGILGALLLIFKGYVCFFSVGDYCSSTIQTIINPILILSIWGYLILIRRKEIEMQIKRLLNKG